LALFCVGHCHEERKLREGEKEEKGRREKAEKRNKREGRKKEKKSCFESVEKDIYERRGLNVTRAL
jgi:hypothetical protein